MAVTLPGLAERESELAPTTGLMVHVRDVLALADRHNLLDAVLGGQSYAGAVVGVVTRCAPHRCRSPVYGDTMPGRRASSTASPRMAARSS
jgi:hypothetical protein